MQQQIVIYRVKVPTEEVSVWLGSLGQRRRSNPW